MRRIAPLLHRRGPFKRLGLGFLVGLRGGSTWFAISPILPIFLYCELSRS